MSKVAASPCASLQASALEWKGFQPFQLVSLLTVLDKFAYGFYNIGKSLAETEDLARVSARYGNAQFSKETITKIRDLLEVMKTWCVDLDSTLKGIERILSLPDSEFYGNNIEQMLGELRRRLDDQVENLRFIYVSSERASYYEQVDLFGIKAKFPKANEEVRLAGNCFATGNNTACIFHLMHAIEIGAKVMVIAMKAQKHIKTTVSVQGVRTSKLIPIELCDWQKLITGMRMALVEMEKGKTTSLKTKQTHAYYSEAVSSFIFFKDAWRNIISHATGIGESGRLNYLPGETEDIMRNTKQFLSHLAKRLKEPERPV